MVVEHVPPRHYDSNWNAIILSTIYRNMYIFVDHFVQITSCSRKSHQKCTTSIVKRATSIGFDPKKLSFYSLRGSKKSELFSILFSGFTMTAHLVGDLKYIRNFAAYEIFDIVSNMKDAYLCKSYPATKPLSKRNSCCCISGAIQQRMFRSFPLFHPWLIPRHRR